MRDSHTQTPSLDYPRLPFGPEHQLDRQLNQDIGLDNDLGLDLGPGLGRGSGIGLPGLARGIYSLATPPPQHESDRDMGRGR
jgi:hypothetical protein